MEQNNHLTDFAKVLEAKQETKLTNHLVNFTKALGTKQVTEKRTAFTYVSWSDAWESFKKIYPLATYEIVKFDGLPYKDCNNKGVIVYTTVTADGLTYEMFLPVLDGANKPMKNEPYKYEGNAWINGQKKTIEKTCDAYDIFDINKAIMRCLTKNLAMFGIGLYVYQGEDLPEVASDTLPEVKKTVAPIQKVTPAPKEPAILPKAVTTEPQTFDRIAIAISQPIPAPKKTSGITPIINDRQLLNDELDNLLVGKLEKLMANNEKNTLSIISSKKLGYQDATDEQQRKRITWVKGV